MMTDEQQDAVSEAFKKLLRSLEKEGLFLDFFRIEVVDEEENRHQCTVIGEGELRVVSV